MTEKIKNPVCGGAEVSLRSEFATKIVNGQIHSGYALVVLFKDTSRVINLFSCDAVRSFIAIAKSQSGLTRAHALASYFILSLSQHVHDIRIACDDYHVIKTERVGKKRYGRYHVSPHIEIKLFKLREI